jgi:hypothetical protein
MAHPSKQTWLVACAGMAPPKLPEAPTGVTMVLHKKGSEMHRLCSEVIGYQPQLVVALSATTTGDEVRVCAQALADMTKGNLLTDLPSEWTMKIVGEVIPPFEEAWANLAKAAAEGSKLLAQEKKDWKADEKDDWKDV